MLLKTLFYVSKARKKTFNSLIPTDIAKILYVSRKSNEEFYISGVLSYRDGNYFQIIEGPVESVDRLFLNIKNDDRHTEIKTIYERETSFRVFQNCPMTLVHKEDQTPIIRYINTYFLDNSTRSRNALRVLSRFFDLGDLYNKKARDLSAASSYKNKDLSLKKWPRFSKSPPLALVELCISLKQFPKSYEFHVNQNPFNDIDELERSLKSLEANGWLVVQDKPKHTTYSSIKKSLHTSSFYQKMHHFLTNTQGN